MVKMLALATVLALAACTTPSGTFCDIAEQHSFSDEAIAAMSDIEVERELAHNRKGEQLCNWKPRRTSNASPS